MAFLAGERELVAAERRGVDDVDRELLAAAGFLLVELARPLAAFLAELPPVVERERLRG